MFDNQLLLELWYPKTIIKGILSTILIDDGSV